ncbi:AAA family ATPase [Rhodopseudomonas sp. BR0G17]|uniref:ATP-dependent nuclease n=1 Tax=Rhodopseudomonas sp. BR0G17 TaxID=2269368 RepID=UPI0013E07108|nr:AAA family ATPase [Rhodopseudomonas sp. BR0G17]NEW96504.1 hypothetical protein [Rhodopseudomonas sp. BR0G17]
MHLRKLRITNFRAIEEIDVEFEKLTNVIIGPNAVGKTTILEAIRLAKSVLAPRTTSETVQTLISLGLASPHIPQSIQASAAASDTAKSTSVRCTFRVEDSEISTIEALKPTIPPRVALHNAGLAQATVAQAMPYLQSPQGRAALSHASEQIASEIAKLSATKEIHLNLNIDYASGTVSGENPTQQILYATLEQSLDPTRTIFSYFPADRAMPIGEQPVQLGMADTNQQLESYNSQPQLKYNRLKNMIFSTIIGHPEGRILLSEQFRLIFDRVLKGRALGNIGVNSIGMLSIPIIDVDSQRQFDIDGLSSGEKGLILTTLLIAQSIADNGMILLDEPELHLNPAVCHDLLQFLVEEFSLKKNMQSIICSHSAEILAGALDRNDCALYHLRNGRTLARVRQQDQGEIRDALRRLGSSESEALLYKGTISVEGIHDAEILRSGFDDIVRRYKVKQLGGRSQIESDIKELQAAECRGDEIGLHYFLFDHDGKPSNLRDSLLVKMRQLQRYCLENYLLDAEILTDISRDKELSDSPFSNLTETTNTMKKHAISQLEVVAARSVFRELGLENICFDMKAIDKAPRAAADAIWSRIEIFENSFRDLRTKGFAELYAKMYDGKFEELKALWDDDWRNLCNGKLLLEELRKAGHIKGDLLRVKRRIASEMRLRGTDSYNTLVGILNDLLIGKPS